MNCEEFQEVLPDVIEGGRSAEQEAHLQSCIECSGLVAELDLIAGEARQLQNWKTERPGSGIQLRLRCGRKV